MECINKSVKLSGHFVSALITQNYIISTHHINKNITQNVNHTKNQPKNINHTKHKMEQKPIDMAIQLARLPIDIYVLIISYCGTKIQRRKLYYSLALTVRTFAVESLKKRFSIELKKTLTLSTFTPVSDELNCYVMVQSTSEVIAEYNLQTGNINSFDSSVLLNMYEYITLTKSARDSMYDITNAGLLQSLVLRYKSIKKRSQLDNVPDVKERMEIFENYVFYQKIHSSEYKMFFDAKYYKGVIVENNYDINIIRQTLMARKIPHIDKYSLRTEMKQTAKLYIVFD